MKINKTAVLISIGASLEYYDFIVYAFLAQYISFAFFPLHNPVVSIIASFGLFAAGYIVRPVGGVIFGSFGDRFGRKKIFLISILLMAVSTFFMGVVPSYENIGISASVIMVILRILQGISFGAELPGATTFITEHSDKSMRGLNCAFMVVFVTFGVLLGSFIIYFLNLLLGTENMKLWGWRIPFFIGGFLAVTAYFIRVKINESPYFENNKNKQKNPFWYLIRNYPRKILIVSGFIIFPSSLVMFVLCMPVYFNLVYGYKSANVYFAISIGYVWSIITLLIFGFFADKYNRRKVFSITLFFFILLCIFYFKMLDGGNSVNLIIYIMIYQTVVSLCTICYYPIISENFPTEIRYTGIALCYNAVYAMTSLVPMVVNIIYKNTKSNHSAPLLLVLLALVSFICSFFIKDYSGKDMEL